MRPIIQVLVRAKSHPHRLPGCPHLPRHRLGDLLVEQRQNRRGDVAEFAVFDGAVEAVSYQILLICCGKTQAKAYGYLFY